MYEYLNSIFSSKSNPNLFLDSIFLSPSFPLVYQAAPRAYKQSHDFLRNREISFPSVTSSRIGITYGWKSRSTRISAAGTYYKRPLLLRNNKWRVPFNRFTVDSPRKGEPEMKNVTTVYIHVSFSPSLFFSLSPDLWNRISGQRDK